MIDSGVDFEIEKLFMMYRRVGLFMPLVVLKYDNRMAFNTRSISKRNLLSNIVQRTGSSRYITGGRVLSVSKAGFSRNIESIRAVVGGRVVSQARDPDFMARLEFGGEVPSGRFGQTAIPTIKGARRGSRTGNISKAATAPVLAAKAVTARNITGSPKQKQAVALSVGLRTRKRIVKMKDNQGRDSIYRIKGSGRGRKRKISQIVKLWTLSRKTHSTRGIHWLNRATNDAVRERAKVFRRIAEQEIRRKALKSS